MSDFRVRSSCFPEKRDGRTYVQLVDDNERRTRFEMKDTAKMSTLIDAYSSHTKTPIEQIRFYYGGALVRSSDTASSLDVAWGDVIHVFTKPLPPKTNIKTRKCKS